MACCLPIHVPSRLQQLDRSRQLFSGQIQFIDLMVNHLTERGVIDAALHYERPFTDVSDQGLTGVFPPKESADVLKIVRRIAETAAA